MIKGRMQKPDFVEAQQSITNILKIDNQLKVVLDEENGQQVAVRNVIKSMHDAKVRQTLENLDIEQINKDKLGIRVSALRDVGIHNVWRIHNMSIQEIYNIHGIGKQSAYKIKEVADLIARSVNESTYVRISLDQRSDTDNKLIQALYILVNTKDIRSACHMLYNTNHSSILTNVAQSKRVQSSFLWFFSGRTKKETAFENLEKINALLSGEYGNRSCSLYKEYQQIITASISVCWADFEYRSSAYYAQLEIVDHSRVKNEVIQNGIPEQLASQVESYPLKLNLMKSTLRRYQEFGAKYTLRQHNVLLGDEMGLGKTVQAIAAISSLKEDGQTHFMVVCPAGVLVNWYREIGMHSELNAVKIHGENCMAIKEWIDNGGIAVTTYESINKISLPDEFKINVLVADEAHYVKNPNANRTSAL